MLGSLPSRPRLRGAVAIAHGSCSAQGIFSFCPADHSPRRRGPAHLRRAFIRPARSFRFQDIALQTFACVPEKGVDERPCNGAAHAERETWLDRHAVGEPRTPRRNLLKQVVLRERMDERHGMRREMEREAAIPLPAEEVLVKTEQRKPDRPGGSHAVRLVAGPDHLAHAGKPYGPGFSV